MRFCNEHNRPIYALCFPNLVKKLSECYEGDLKKPISLRFNCWLFTRNAKFVTRYEEYIFMLFDLPFCPVLSYACCI